MDADDARSDLFSLAPGSDGPWVSWGFDEVHQEHGWQVWQLDPGTGARWDLAFVPGTVAETPEQVVIALRQHLHDLLGGPLD